MITKGNRRGGAKQLADHLLRRDTNEDVIIREIDGYPTKELGDQDLRNALRFMAAQGQSKEKFRVLYHSIMALQEGEILTGEQLRHAVDTYAKNLGMEGHQRAIVEHRKAGRQHFHIIFNILHPVTGKQAELRFTRRTEWNTSRQLEQELGLKPVIATGRSARRWECERGKRTGIDPLKVRKEVTAIYRASKTSTDFIAALTKAGYVLTKGRHDAYVIVDRAGEIHGLMRRIEGAKLKDLRQKFPDLKNATLPPLDRILKELRPVRASRKITRGFRNIAYALGRANMGKVSGNHMARMPVTKAAGNKTPVRPHTNLAAIRAIVSQQIKSQGRSFGYPVRQRKKRKGDENVPDSEKLPFRDPAMERAEHIAWAIENGQLDVLTQYGFSFASEFEP